MKRIGVVGILVLALFGLADSAYLAEHKADGTPLICNVEGLSGCNVVAESKYSDIFGIPVADFGILFYSILFVIAALELVLFDRLLRRALQGFAVIGLLVSIYSVSTQLFYIQALCIYCLASAAVTVLVFIIAGFLEPISLSRKHKRDAPTDPRPPLQMPPAA